MRRKLQRRKGGSQDAYQLESYKMVFLQKMKGPTLTLVRGIKEVRRLDKLQNPLQNTRPCHTSTKNNHRIAPNVQFLFSTTNPARLQVCLPDRQAAVATSSSYRSGQKHAGVIRLPALMLRLWFECYYSVSRTKSARL
jgi:hypothetical protein